MSCHTTFVSPIPLLSSPPLFSPNSFSHCPRIPPFSLRGFCVHTHIAYEQEWRPRDVPPPPPPLFLGVNDREGIESKGGRENFMQIRQREKGVEGRMKRERETSCFFSSRSACYNNRILFRVRISQIVRTRRGGEGATSEKSNGLPM